MMFSGLTSLQEEEIRKNYNQLIMRWAADVLTDLLLILVLEIILI
jgi:hypothetical protein